MEILLDLGITILAYMTAPFIAFFRNDKYDNKQKRKFILYNSIIVAFCFIIIRAELGYENPVISFSPALLYYYINKWVWVKREPKDNVETEKKTTEEKAKKENMERSKAEKVNLKSKKYKAENKDKLKAIFTCIIISTIIIGGTISFSIVIKEEAEKDKLQLKLDNENANEEKRQNSLSNCIANAKTARNNLWNANCTKQSDGSCTINNNSGTIEWIEKRYQQDLNNCYQLYGN